MRFDPTSIVSWMITALFFLGLAYVVLYGLTLYLKFRSGRLEGNEAMIRTVANDISAAMGHVWFFVRPILQLVLVLFVVYWFSQTIGLTKETLVAYGAQDIKTTLALFVIGAFCVASFLSESPASWLKDIVLVVIGFYFGTRSGG